MKTMVATMAAALLVTPALALPTAWSSGFNMGIHEYSVGPFAEGATNLIISCPTEGDPSLSVQIKGALPPSDEQVGFKAAGRTVLMRAGGKGGLRIDSSAKRAQFAQLWAALRAGSSVTISYVDGASAILPLTGSGRTLPARPCVQ